MTFVTYSYYLFLAGSLVLYYILPHRFRWGVLLAASIVFCSSLNMHSTIWLVTTACVSYFAAIGMDILNSKQHRRLSKFLLILSLIVLFGSLFLMKYLPMFLDISEKIVTRVTGHAWTAPALSLAMPVGISFYLFQVTGYLIDVYRRKTPLVRHFGHYVLSVTFFAKLTQGPIAPVEQLAPQFAVPVRLDPLAMRKGAFRILLGLFKKTVIADRLAVAADFVFANPIESNALTVVIGTVFYAFQLYTDFAGYTDMAVGSAQLFGITLPENFRQPYLARSIADLWRRWHMTLSSWLRTYVYFPLGGSRVKQWRWAFNVLVVFLVSGVWHGSGLTFVIWGLLHGLYQIIGKYTAQLRTVYKERLMGRDTWLSTFTSVFCTFVLVCIAWVFFRAPSATAAVTMLSSLFGGDWSFSLAQLGIKANEWYMSCGMILLTVVMDLVSEHHSIPDWVEARHLIIRWPVYLVLLFMVILFGMYGSLSAQSFIYVSF